MVLNDGLLHIVISVSVGLGSALHISRRFLLFESRHSKFENTHDGSGARLKMAWSCLRFVFMVVYFDFNVYTRLRILGS